MQTNKKEQPKKFEKPRLINGRHGSHFDGACRGIPGKCGAGGTIIIGDNHVVALKVAVGVGTNNGVEIFALC